MRRMQRCGNILLRQKARHELLRMWQIRYGSRRGFTARHGQHKRYKQKKESWQQMGEHLTE